MNRSLVCMHYRLDWIYWSSMNAESFSQISVSWFPKGRLDRLARTQNSHPEVVLSLSNINHGRNTKHVTHKPARQLKSCYPRIHALGGWPGRHSLLRCDYCRNTEAAVVLRVWADCRKDAVFANLLFGECERESSTSLPSVCIGLVCCGVRQQLLVVSDRGSYFRTAWAFSQKVKVFIAAKSVTAMHIAYIPMKPIN